MFQWLFQLHTQVRLMGCEQLTEKVMVLPRVHCVTGSVTYLGDVAKRPQDIRENSGWERWGVRKKITHEEIELTTSKRSKWNVIH